jgi:AAA15 family ATPase/GTPase
MKGFKTMAWYLRLFKAIESFAESAYRKPIWYFWTIVVGGCISVLVPYHLSYLEEQAKLEKSILEQKTLIEDGGRICSLHEEVKAKSLASSELFQKLQSITKDTVDLQSMEKREQQIQEIYRLATEDKEQTVLLLAKVKGTHLRVNVFDEEIQTYQVLLATDISTMEVIESFCSAYLSRNVEYIEQQIPQVSGQFTSLRGELKNATARLESLGFRQQSTVKSILIENKKLVSQVKAQKYKEYALLPAISLPIMYLLTIFAGVINAWRKARPQGLRQKRFISRPKKGKK